MLTLVNPLAAREHVVDLVQASSEGEFGANLRDPLRLVGLPGFVENPAAYMARASVFVLSSAWEGFSNTLVEALACGCPVVSTDCPSGPAEILRQGKLGPLVPVGDDAAMADAILRVLGAPPDPEPLRLRADNFSVDRATERYLEVLEAARARRTAVWAPGRRRAERPAGA